MYLSKKGEAGSRCPRAASRTVRLRSRPPEEDGARALNDRKGLESGSQLGQKSPVRSVPSGFHIAYYPVFPNSWKSEDFYVKTGIFWLLLLKTTPSPPPEETSAVVGHILTLGLTPAAPTHT